MTKSEFIDKLEKELKRNNVSDAADIINEYEQHFAFRLADGYSEEEIAARLGSPTALATQFEPSAAEKCVGRKALTVIGLCFADFFVGCFFCLLFAWEIIMAAAALCCGVACVCLLCGLNIYGLIPSMPYGCGAIIGMSVGALAVLLTVGGAYFFAFLRQLLRAYGRFHHNALAASSGKPTLPSLAIHPQFSSKTRRRIRSAALIALVLFAVLFVLGMVTSMLSAGSLEFWHTWGWFGF